MCIDATIKLIKDVVQCLEKYTNMNLQILLLVLEKWSMN